jgi:hypothetical protein
MLADHAGVLVGHGKVSDGGDDDSGIRMAAALGAATRRMGAVKASLVAPPAMVDNGILVNALGRRFIDEDVYPGTYSHAALLHEPAPWWIITDEEGFEAIVKTDAPGLCPQHVGETATELERDLGMPLGSLEATITTYNRNASRGEDPLFHKRHVHRRWDLLRTARGTGRIRLIAPAADDEGGLLTGRIFILYRPSREYGPDGARVFGGRSYVLGSHDRFNGKKCCENDWLSMDQTSQGPGRERARRPCRPRDGRRRGHPAGALCAGPPTRARASSSRTGGRATVGSLEYNNQDGRP